MNNLSLKNALLAVVIAVVIGSVFVGCAADPVSTSKTDNKDVQVDKLFTHDGCTVYRFSDESTYHYYAVCDAGRSVSTQSRVSEGKSSRPEEIATTEQQ